MKIIASIVLGIIFTALAFVTVYFLGVYLVMALGVALVLFFMYFIGDGLIKIVKGW